MSALLPLPPSPPGELSEYLQWLAARLVLLEARLGQPDAPPGIEDEVVALAHELRNGVQVRRSILLLESLDRAG